MQCVVCFNDINIIWTLVDYKRWTATVETEQINSNGIVRPITSYVYGKLNNRYPLVKCVVWICIRFREIPTRKKENHAYQLRHVSVGIFMNRVFRTTRNTWPGRTISEYFGYAVARFESWPLRVRGACIIWIVSQSITLPAYVITSR